MPAYRFVRFDYIPPVAADYLSKIAKAMQQKEGFFLTASLKQDRKSRGTILALEGPGASQRQFEIVSNGPADTLDLTYWVEGAQHVISLEDVGLADSQWKSITVQVAGEVYSLYVGCNLIDSFTLDEPFYEQLTTEKSRMYVAKGSVRESHFRVRMVDASKWEQREEAVAEISPPAMPVGQVWHGGPHRIMRMQAYMRTCACTEAMHNTCIWTHTRHVHHTCHTHSHMCTPKAVHTCASLHTLACTGHTHAHTCTCTCTHKVSHECTQERTYSHVCAHLHVQGYTLTHLPTQEHAHAHMYAHTCTCGHTYMLTCVHTPACTWTNTHASVPF